MKRNESDTPTSRGALVLAGIVSLVVGSLVPFGGLLLYPFTLLATWVHEMGHGLVALIVGGRFENLEIFANASGLAHVTRAAGWRSGLVSLAGLVAPAVVGALILAGARGGRRARGLLVVLGVAMLGSLLVWVRSVTGCIAVPLVAGVLLAVAIRGSARERVFLAQLIGLRLALDTLGRGLSYLFEDSVVVDGIEARSDIASVASELGGPRLAWSFLVAAVCILLVVAGLFASWRPRHPIGY